MDNKEDNIFIVCPQDTVIKIEFERVYNHNFELKTKFGYYTFDKE